MTKNYKNTYQLNRARAASEAKTRENMLLVEAAGRAGLEDIQYQWEGIAETGQLFIFDVTGIYRGRRFLFDLSLHYRDDNAPAKRTKEVLARKRDWATSQGYTHAVVYRHGDINDYVYKIKKIAASYLTEAGELVGSGWL